MTAAETDHPCDRNGQALRCETCGAKALYRRPVAHRDNIGVVFRMGIRGEPIAPVSTESWEILCGDCLHNMGKLELTPVEEVCPDLLSLL